TDACFLSNVKRPLVKHQGGRIVQSTDDDLFLACLAGMARIRQSHDTVGATVRYEQRAIRTEGDKARSMKTSRKNIHLKTRRKVQIDYLSSAAHFVRVRE